MKNYIAGEVILSLDELVKQEFIFCDTVLHHRSWFLRWQVRHLMRSMEAGYIRKAIRAEEWEDENEAD